MKLSKTIIRSIILTASIVPRHASCADSQFRAPPAPGLVALLPLPLVDSFAPPFPAVFVPPQLRAVSELVAGSSSSRLSLASLCFSMCLSSIRFLGFGPEGRGGAACDDDATPGPLPPRITCSIIGLGFVGMRWTWPCKTV